MQPAYDYVIVGAGSAGCVLASRLSERGSNTVALIESGPPDTHPWIAMPGGIGRLMAVPDNPFQWKFSVSPALNRPEEKWISGRTLGGSSAINGMVYVRGAPDDYDAWEAAGCRGWGWSEIGRCFAALENHQLGAGQWRGRDGPLRITLAARDELADAVIAAAAEAGTPTVADINDVNAVRDGGFGYQPRTIWRGRRFSAAAAFLRPALGRPNLDVITKADVSSIDFDGPRATGVRMNHDGIESLLSARREVIIAAGAINSPKLLQLSGIGPAAVLGKLGIKVRVDSPDVGRNLRDHRTVAVTYELTRGGRNSWLRGLGLLRSAARYYIARDGELARATFEAGGFVKTTDGLARPDCQIGAGLFSFGKSGISDHPGMTLYGYFLRPESLGEVTISSADPRVPPKISANYMSAETDRLHTASLYRYMRKLGSQPALAPFVVSEIVPGADRISDDALIDASFAQGYPGYHAAGTCRMGSDAAAVLDPELRVRGTHALRVVDASVMPQLVSGNTNAPVMAIAWRASELIMQERGGTE